MNRRLGLLVLMSQLANGCALVGGLAPAEPVRVRIENPEGLPLILYGLREDQKVYTEELGRNTQVERRLSPSAYWLEAGAGPSASRYPVPAYPEALRGDALVIEVHPSPPLEHGLAFIPAGPSLQGDVIGVGQEDERPVHIAWISSFWIATHEVTNEEFAAFLNGAGRAPDPDWANLESHKFLIRPDPATGRYVTDAAKLPVVTVTWVGANAYCEWLSRSTGTRYRLPTEAEWEKAARGPESGTYAYGNVYTASKANQESGRLRPVQSFAANSYGLYDMTGNAFEWVADVYDPKAYSKRVLLPIADPVETSAAGAESEPYHLLRGGSFVLDGVYLRNSFRMRYRPTVKADDIGFRVVREVPKLQRAN